MMNFRYLYIGFGEAVIETYNTNGSLGGEISFQYLQQQGLMGLVDHLNTKTAKLENIRLNKDTLWFLFRFNQYSEHQKGFLSYFAGKRILGIPSALAYRVPCSNRLPSVHSIDGAFQVLLESNLHGIPGPSFTTKFRACLDSLSNDDFRGWENEVKEYKFVSDSVIGKISKKAN